MKKPRPITAVDRMLAWVDRVDPSTRVEAARAGHPYARRRTHRRFGQLDLVVVEQTDVPTVVYLSNDEGVIVETTATDMLEAADAVRDLLTRPLGGVQSKKRGRP